VLHSPVICTIWPSSNSTAQRTRGTCANRQQRHSNTTMSYSMDLDVERNVLPASASRSSEHSSPAKLAKTSQRSVRPVHSPSTRATDTIDVRFTCHECGRQYRQTGSLKRHQRHCFPAHPPERLTCGGKFLDGRSWGCGRRFGRVDSLARHHKFKHCKGSRSEQQEGAPYTKVGIHPCGCHSRSSLTA
jgi:hypothetical protein